MTKKKATSITLPFYGDSHEPPINRLAERLQALGFKPCDPIVEGETREGDFLCRDKGDGLGAYIAKWRTAKPLPTPEELLAVEL